MASPFHVFHQREDLTTRIRNILRDYPRGTLPLREFVQNADDAGAKRFTVMLNKRESGTAIPPVHGDGGESGGYMSSQMRDFDRRDSLFIFNDATFKDKDFESITSLGNSMKQADQTTVGKYGLGFNVAYHYSDVVMFASRNQLVVFDPHQGHLPEGLPGLRADFTSSTFRERFPQQLEGISRAAETLGCPLRTEKEFDGTLFQLPLRTVSEAEHSKISSASIDSSELTAVLREFALSAAELLVFLKHVEEIQVLVSIESKSGVRVERVGHARVSNVDAQLRHQRCLLEHLSVSMTTYMLELEHVVRGEDCKTQSWLVHGRLHQSATAEPLSLALRERPFLGAALRLDADASHEELCANGRPYCFLPLPLKTGLPVHLNAFFALSSNRRGLWTGDNETGGGDGVVRERWNAMLLQEALPIAYGELLSALSTRPGVDAATVYKFWPSMAAAAGSFRQVAEGLVDRVVSAAEAGAVRTEPFPLLFDGVGQQWTAMAGNDVVFETSHSRAHCGHRVRQQLQRAGVAVVDPPTHVREAIHSRFALSTTSTEATRDADSNEKEERLVWLSAAVAVQRLAGQQLEPEAGAELLSFCWERSAPAAALLVPAASKASYTSSQDSASNALQDTLHPPSSTTSTEGVRTVTLKALMDSDCACVPVAGGEMRPVRGQDSGTQYGDQDLVLCSEEWQPLLCGPQFGIVDCRRREEEGECWEMASKVLQLLCESGQTNIRQLVARDVSRRMPYLLPSHWRGHDIVVLEEADGEESVSTLGDKAVPSHLKTRTHAVLRKLAGKEGVSSRIVDWMDRLEVLWRFLQHECLADTSHLSLSECRKTTSSDAAREVLSLFDSWPIVPLACGAFVTCSEARSVGVLSRSDLSDAELTLMRRCLVHVTPLHNSLVSALLFASRADACRALALTFESGVALNSVGDDARHELRRQILRWKAEADQNKSPGDAPATVIEKAGAQQAMTFEVSHVRRLPVFATLDGALKPLTKELFATPPPPTTRDAYHAVSTWDQVLAEVCGLGGRIVSYEDSDARALLAMANSPRPEDEFEVLARLCSLQLLSSLTEQAWMEVLRAAARVKPWRKPRTPKMLEAFAAHRVVFEGDSRHLASSVVDTTDSLLMACIDKSAVLRDASHVVLPPAYSEPGVLAVLRHMGLITIGSPDGFLLAAKAVAEKRDVGLAFQLLAELVKLHKDRSTPPWPSRTYDALAVVPFVPGIVHEPSQEWPTHGAGPEFVVPVASALQRQGGGARSKQHEQRGGASGRHAAAEEDAMFAHDRLLDFAQEQVEEAASYLADAAWSAEPVWELSRFGQGVLYSGAWTAFTVCPVLPAECDALPAALLQRLHVAHPPPAKTIAQHLGNLCAAWRRSASQARPTEEETQRRQAMVQLCMVDLCLQRAQLSSSIGRSLHTTAFVVLDDGELVPPANLLFELRSSDSDLAPDVRAPPAFLEPYADLFAAISERSSDALLSLPPPPVVVDATPPAATMEQLQAEFDRRALSDVCMRLGPDDFVFLHRVILGLASPLFRTLFSSPMSASAPADDHDFHAAAGTQWRLLAPEWASPAAVRAFLWYLYSGTLPDGLDPAVPPTQEHVTGAIELLRLAGFYECAHLQQSCEAYLASAEGVAQLTNLLELLALAEDTHATQLRAHVVHRARDALHVMKALPEWEGLTDAVKRELTANNSQRRS